MIWFTPIFLRQILEPDGGKYQVKAVDNEASASQTWSTKELRWGKRGNEAVLVPVPLDWNALCFNREYLHHSLVECKEGKRGVQFSEIYQGFRTLCPHYIYISSKVVAETQYVQGMLEDLGSTMQTVLSRQHPSVTSALVPLVGEPL